MKRFVLLTREPIETVLSGGTRSDPDGSARPVPTAVSDRVRTDGRDGAWLDFYGIVRDREPDGAPITAIEYEAHASMAEHQLHRILDRLGERYPLSAVVLIHRIGRVPVGEPSLLVRILSPHREESLRACADLIDELKREVPIWKHPR